MCKEGLEVESNNISIEESKCGLCDWVAEKEVGSDQDKDLVGHKNYVAGIKNFEIQPKNNRKTLKGFKQKEDI